MSTTAGATPLDSAALLAEAEKLVDAGRALEALDLVAEGCARSDDPALEIRLAELRNAAFAHVEGDGFDQWPAPVDGVERGGAPEIPEVQPHELDATVLRRQIQSRGALLVRGLLRGRTEPFIEGIEAAFAAKDAAADGGDASSWYRPLPLGRQDAQSLGRYWVSAAGGMLGCDSPRLLRLMLTTYDELGLRQVVGDYLGERPVLSANKCTFRRVPLTSNTDWHQDGAFLGDGIRALNIWVALTDCGVDAPGMDLVPKRFDAVVETGTGGAYFDWAVGSETVATVAVDAPPVRPHFRAGDALLFDDLFLHRTAIDDTMTRPRYAIESWFFAPTDYPSGQVPLVW